MMMNRTLKLILCKLLLLPLLAVAAEDWYQIELIAFQYVNPEGDPELWASHPGEPNWSSGMNLYASQDAARAARGVVDTLPATANVTPNDEGDEHGFVTVGQLVGAETQTTQVPIKKIREMPFVSLSQSQNTLQGVEKIMTENPNYKILARAAWRQPALSGREVETVHVYGGKSANAWDIEGLVTFKKSRYLHLDADFLLREGDTTYRMSQSQRVRSGKLYYYDHPLMGLIVKITPYEPN